MSAVRSCDGTRFERSWITVEAPRAERLTCAMPSTNLRKGVTNFKVHVPRDPSWWQHLHAFAYRTSKANMRVCQLKENGMRVSSALV